MVDGESDHDVCERCGKDTLPENIQTIDLSEERELCDGCVVALDETIEYHDWWDRYTREQHQRAVSLLSERDEIECVINSYEDAQIVVHTPYVSSNVVKDFCYHFGFEIVKFGPQWAEDGNWPCVDMHGSVFEIVLEYNHNCPPPIPLSVVFDYIYIDRLDENDKQF